MGSVGRNDFSGQEQGTSVVIHLREDRGLP